MEIRPLRPDELDAAIGMLHVAGLGLSREDLALACMLQPEGYFAALEGGRLIGTVGAVSYGTFAFVGALGVIPEQQRRGVGGALMRHVLAWIAAQGIELTLLEATDQGYPLYRRLGFVEQFSTLVYRREQGAGSDLDCQLARELVEPLGAGVFEELLALDARCFGAGRRGVLERISASELGRAFVARDERGVLAGYLFARERRIGPWVATNATVAEALLDAALALPYAQEPVVLLPGPNSAGAALLLRAGFSPQRRTRRMRLGSGNAGEPTMVYGMASLGIG